MNTMSYRTENNQVKQELKMKVLCRELAKMIQSKASDQEYYGSHAESIVLAGLLATLAGVVQRLAEEHEEQERRIAVLEKELHLV